MLGKVDSTIIYQTLGPEMGPSDCGFVLQLFLSALLYADTSDCLLSSLPHPLIGLLDFYDLIL